MIPHNKQIQSWLSKLYNRFVCWLAKDVISEMDKNINLLIGEINAINKRNGFEVTRVYLGEKEVLHNITEIHFRHNGRNEVTFESDVLGTGWNSKLEFLSEFEATLEDDDL